MRVKGPFPPGDGIPTVDSKGNSQLSTKEAREMNMWYRGALMGIAAREARARRDLESGCQAKEGKAQDVDSPTQPDEIHGQVRAGDRAPREISAVDSHRHFWSLPGHHLQEHRN